MFRNLRQYLRERRQAREHDALEEIKARYHAFRIFLENNGRALELIIAMDSLLEHGETEEIRSTADELLRVCGELVDGLHLLSGGTHGDLFGLYSRMSAEVGESLEAFSALPRHTPLCLALDDLGPGAQAHAGSKAANLAQLRRMGLPTMDGFVATTTACKHFLGGAEAGKEYGGGDLMTAIRALLRDRGRGGKSGQDMEAVSEQISALILGAAMPGDLRREMETALAALAGREGREPSLSARSSGVAEDRPEHSFAGQFTSILGVNGLEALARAYKEVVASGFSARALTYRRRIGLSPADFDMAVLCQVMVEPRCAGVLLSRDPADQDSGAMLVSAAPGLGTLAVDGSAPVDLYRPARSDSGGTDGPSQIAHKTVREVADGAGGLRREPYPDDLADQPLLDQATLRELVRYAERIESLDGLPLDMEWAVDQEGEIRILQARPLKLPPKPRSEGASAANKGGGREARVLASGIPASPGKGVGRAVVVRSPEELDKAVAQALHPSDGESSDPAILLLPQGLVDAARHLCSFEGVAVDVGNPTDHLSCVAREQGVPLITGATRASQNIENGTWLVLDADNGQVLAADPSLWSGSPRRARPGMGEQAPVCAPPDKGLPPERRHLRDLVVPLNLTDAYGPTFSRKECKSLHDLVRYSHEMAVLAMFDAGDMVMEHAGGLLRKLNIGVPFNFLVIDLGGGLNRDKSGTLSREDVTSAPLAALCDGLMTPGLNWHSRPPGSAVAEAMSKHMLDAASARPAGSFNYALAARDYLNLNARVEYHFAMLDAVCGKDDRANHIRFRFKGGGTGQVRLERRARFLRLVLEAEDFVTVVNHDLVTATLAGAPKALIEERLVMLGRLFGYSRFLDALMEDDDTPDKLAEHFLAGRWHTRDVKEGDADQA